MKKILEANSRRALNVLSMGLFHDHCWHYYNGKVENIPKKYIHLVKENKKYCLIYEEKH